jgi:drug/metabolite transporter (DMT)-like permease
MTASSKPRWQVVLALGTVYLVWGSTYLAIWVAVEGMPPFVMGALRFGTAALVLCGVALAARHERPTAMQAAGAFLTGVLILGIGNGGVVFAAGRLPSGVAALLIASLPLWVLSFEALADGKRPSARAIGACMLGLAGVGALLVPDLLAPSHPGALLGPRGLGAAAVVLAGTALWAAGQLVGRRVEAPASDLWNAACSLASAAAVFALGAAVNGEWARLDLAATPAPVWGALAYLVVFGSCLAWSAFAWLVRHVRPGLVATYAYVNPLVAVLLGVWWLHEPFTRGVAAGGALVVAAVVLATRPAAPPAPADEPA